MTRKDLPELLHKILQKMGGKARMMDIFKRFWATYGCDLKETDDLFYTWNYDIRWAATTLRKNGIMKQAKTKENTHGTPQSPNGIWELS